jgi:hypothetical protein
MHLGTCDVHSPLLRLSMIPVHDECKVKRTSASTVGGVCRQDRLGLPLGSLGVKHPVIH